MTSRGDGPAGRPFLRVVRGEPDDAELAALTVVLAAVVAAAAAPEEQPRAASAWSDRRDLLRRPLPVGPGAWRTSSWPR